MFKIKVKSKMKAVAAAFAALMCSLGGINAVAANAAENVTDKAEVSVRYYNGGFWSTMMTNNDFKNNLNGVVLNQETDELSFNADVDANVTAWGPNDAVRDEYCDWSEAKSLVVEVKNRSNFIADFRMFFSGYTTAEKSEESHFCAGAGKTYYYKSKDGNVSTSAVGIYSAGGLNIPANFDGYIVIPTSEIAEYWSGGKVSLACVKRINFTFDAEWSKGEVTFGKVGYSTGEGAETAGTGLTFSPMIAEETFKFDEYDNDVKYIKNWLYNLNVDYLDGEVKKADGNAEIKLADNSDELKVGFSNIASDVYLWCDNFTAEDTNLSAYRYFMLDVKNYGNTPVSLGFVLTTGLENPKKAHFGFLSDGVRLVARNAEAGTLAPVATTDGYFVTVPATFDGYLAFEMNAEKMYQTNLSEYAEAFNAANIGSINLFLKNGTSGNFSLGRPQAAKSNKILDAAYPINKTIDNDTKSARFRLFGQSKIYDGKPFEIQVSQAFENDCAIQWYALKGSEQVLLSEVPVNAGEYIVKAKAKNYFYEAELSLSISRADPAPLIKLADETYYAGEKITSLTLAEDSIRGTLSITPVTLSLGENTLNFFFVPENENYSSISASCTVVAVKKSPAGQIKFETRIYYTGETIKTLSLAKDSLAGKVSVESLTLIAGENTLRYKFIPDSSNFETYNGTLVVEAQDPVYTIDISDKIYDGQAISVTVSGYPFEYTLAFYKKAENGEYVKITDAPMEAGEYKVVLSSEELGEGQSKEFRITERKAEEKKSGCSGSIVASGVGGVFFAAAAVSVLLVSTRRRRVEK